MCFLTFAHWSFTDFDQCFRPLIGDVFLNMSKLIAESLPIVSFRPLIGDVFLNMSKLIAESLPIVSFRPLIGDVFLNSGS